MALKMWGVPLQKMWVVSGNVCALIGESIATSSLIRTPTSRMKQVFFSSRENALLLGESSRSHKVAGSSCIIYQWSSMYVIIVCHMSNLHTYSRKLSGVQFPDSRSLPFRRFNVCYKVAIYINTKIGPLKISCHVIKKWQTIHLISHQLHLMYMKEYQIHSSLTWNLIIITVFILQP